MALFPAYGPSSDDDSNFLLTSKDNVETLVDSDGAPEIPTVFDVPDPISTTRSTRSKKEKRKKKSTVCYTDISDPIPTTQSTHGKKEKTEKKSTDYYEDVKIDYGNVRVSTLYRPARPKYENLKVGIGNHRLSQKTKKLKIKRYYSSTVSSDSSDDNDCGKKSHKRRITSDFIPLEYNKDKYKIIDIEKILLERTAKFTKDLDKNPYNVDMWLEYVKFQEVRLMHELESKNIVNRTSAKKNCQEKQLLILDSSLKHNLNNLKLLCKKFGISHQLLSNDEYLALLKTFVSSPGLPKTLLCRGWYWYIDGVQCSMALFSVPSVKEVYFKAIKTLNIAYIDLIYRLSLFLRQAGLWEQLWMLLKLNLLTEESFNVTEENKEQIIDMENEILKSGLPSHEVWARIEKMRSKMHWLPCAEESDDPQRNVFSFDFIDIIKPITNESNLFTFVINMFRLFKIPVLTMSNGLYLSLGFSIDWEYDVIEECFPFLYITITNMPFDHHRFQNFCKIIKDFIQEPNCLNVAYFNFISDVVIKCADMFKADEKTAILLLWMQFLRVLVALYSSLNTLEDVRQKIIKIVKNILKSNRDNTYIYKEYSLLQADVFGVDKGVFVLETCIKTISPSDKNKRINLVRSYVELLLNKKYQDNIKQENINKCILALISLSLEISLEDAVLENIEESLIKYSEYTDNKLFEISNNDINIKLSEYMIPDIVTDWICCYGWLILLTQPDDVFFKFCKKIIVATSVGDTIHNKRLQIREGFFEWLVQLSPLYIRVPEMLHKICKKNVFEKAVEEFPRNTKLIWYAVVSLSGKSLERFKLFHQIRHDDSNELLAVGHILYCYINLYNKYDPFYADSWQVGHSNRLLNFMQTLINSPKLKKCVLIWHMLIEFVAIHTEESISSTKKFIYQALDECPWNKILYYLGCIRAPSEFSELVDIMFSKQIRLHTMPEELEIPS